MTVMLAKLFCQVRVIGLGFILMVFAAHAHAEGKPLKIVVLGDSLVAGYQLGPNEGFVPKLQAALDAAGHNVELIGAGVSGDTTSGGLARLDWSVGEGTHGVILELGANDALRGISVKRSRANLDRILSKLQERGIATLLVGMLAPPNMGEDYGRAFAAMYPILAEKYGTEIYPFFLDGVAAVSSLNLADGMHPNAKGVDVIVERMMPTVVKFVEGMRSGS